MAAGKTYRVQIIETYSKRYTEDDLRALLEQGGLTAELLAEKYDGDLIAAAEDDLSEIGHTEPLERDMEDGAETDSMTLTAEEI